MASFFARKRIACLSILISSVGAQAAEVGPTLTLSQAIERTKSSNPTLAVSLYELKALAVRKDQAMTRANPELSLELEDFAGSGAARGTDSLLATLSLSQTIELGGKRAFRIDAASLQGDLAKIDQQSRELDALSEVTKRFIEVVAAQSQVELARDAAVLSDATVAALKVRVQAARSPQAELSRAQIGATRAKIDLRQAESKLQSARRALAAQWASLDPDFGVAQADLFALAPIVPLVELQERIKASPDITRFAPEARLREAQWQLAKAQARPNLTVSVGIRRLQATGDTALVAGISMPMPIFDRGAGAIAEARIRREQTTAEERAARLRIQSTVAELYEQLGFVREQADLLRNEAIPQAQTALEQSQYGYERGRFSYLELASAQQELIVLRTAAIEAAADFHRLSAEIERLTGSAVASRTR